MKDQKKIPRISELVAGLSEEERVRAEKAFATYLEETVENYEDIRSDPKRYALFKSLTVSKRKPTMKAKPSNHSQPSKSIP